METDPTSGNKYYTLLLYNRPTTIEIAGVSIIHITQQNARQTHARICRHVGNTDALRKGYVDLSRFDAAPLIAFTATKETDYGTATNRRI
jgi:hypothetical protein